MKRRLDDAAKAVERRWCCVCRRKDGDLVLIETWPNLPGHPVWAHPLCMQDVGWASA